MTAGQRGEHGNFGLPSTGMSYRIRLDTPLPYFDCIAFAIRNTPTRIVITSRFAEAMEEV